MRVSQNVGIGLHFAGWSEAKKRDRVAEAINLVALQDYAENNVQDLSGGQQQRGSAGPLPGDGTGTALVG